MWNNGVTADGRVVMGYSEREGRDGVWMGVGVARGAGEEMGVKGFLLGLLMRAVSAGGLSQNSYAAAAVRRDSLREVFRDCSSL